MGIKINNQVKQDGKLTEETPPGYLNGKKERMRYPLLMEMQGKYFKKIVSCSMSNMAFWNCILL